MSNPIYKNLKSWRWRLNNLYYIVDKEGNKIPFRENIIQQKINDSTSSRKIILKARQFGISTNELIKLLDYVLFTDNARACIIAHEQDSIKKLFSIVRSAYENLPDFLRPEIDKGGGSQYEMRFPSMGSKIYCDLEVRGDTIQRLHVSEAAFMKDSSRLKATLQAVPITTGRVTIETTPNGMANYFYDMWTDQDSIYEKNFFPWYLFPDYKIECEKPLDLTDEEKELKKKAMKLFNVELTDAQINFRRFKKSEMKISTFDKTKITFEQEYPEDDKSCFLASGSQVLDLFLIDKMLTESSEPLRVVNGIKIYKEFDKTKKYVCGADPSEGVKRDRSSAVLLEVETLSICAVFNGDLKPSLFAEKLKEMCDLYSNSSSYPPLLVVERNNHGHAVLLCLNDILGYPNLYLHSDERLGFRTDSITRPVMINHFIDAIDNKYLKIPDKEILSQCLTLVNNNGKIEAAIGKNDDLIMALAIAIQVRPLVSSNIYDDIENRIKL